MTAKKIATDVRDWDYRFGWILRYLVIGVLAYAVMFADGRYVQQEAYDDKIREIETEVRAARENVIELRLEMRHVSAALNRIEQKID